MRATTVPPLRKCWVAERQPERPRVAVRTPRLALRAASAAAERGNRGHGAASTMGLKPRRASSAAPASQGPRWAPSKSMPRAGSPRSSQEAGSGAGRRPVIWRRRSRPKRSQRLWPIPLPNAHGARAWPAIRDRRLRALLGQQRVTSSPARVGTARRMPRRPKRLGAQRMNTASARSVRSRWRTGLARGAKISPRGRRPLGWPGA
jgi:hypothetical protein